MDKTEREEYEQLMGDVHGLLSEDPAGYAFEGLAAKLKTAIIKTMDDFDLEHEDVEHIAEFNEEDEGPEPMDTPMFNEIYGG